MFHIFMGYISHVHVGNSPQTVFEEAAGFQKQKLEADWMNVLFVTFITLATAS